MNTISKYDQEEAAHLLWEATGGRERQAAEDLAGMNDVLIDAEKKGWEVLKRWTDSDGWGGTCEHVVLMKNNKEIVRAYYEPFNKGLMKKCETHGGSSLWNVE